MRNIIKFDENETPSQFLRILYVVAIAVSKFLIDIDEILNIIPSISKGMLMRLILMPADLIALNSLFFCNMPVVKTVPWSNK